MGGGWTCVLFLQTANRGCSSGEGEGDLAKARKRAHCLHNALYTFIDGVFAITGIGIFAIIDITDTIEIIDIFVIIASIASIDTSSKIRGEMSGSIGALPEGFVQEANGRVQEGNGQG